MGQATRTTKLPLDLGERDEGGTNTRKRAHLHATARVLNEARAFYIEFFLAHAEKLKEKVSYYSERFPEMPFAYRRSVIKDAIGKVQSHLSNLANWQKTNKKKGKPGLPGARNHPTIYQGLIILDLAQFSTKERYVRLKVYTGEQWEWHNYPVRASRYFQQRLTQANWEKHSPKLVLHKHEASLHFAQTKQITAHKVVQSKQDPDLVTVGVDLNVKNLAVITVRQHDTILRTLFVPDRGLDQARFKHLKRIAKKQHLSGKPVKGEHSNQALWRHVRRMNEDAAHKVARIIAEVCAHYPGCVLLFERLRKIKQRGGSKSRRMNRKQANQLRGKINKYAKAKAFAQGVVTVEINPHGTSQYCSRCGAKGERFSLLGGKRISAKWGKLFACPVCRYQTNADQNASKNMHHSFYHEWHWCPQHTPLSSVKPSG